MGDSNSDWGHLAAHDQGMADALERMEPLPLDGASVPFEAFLATKNLSRTGLLRMGARMKSPLQIAFPHPKGIKYRDLVSGKRSNYKGSKYDTIKIVKAAQRAQGVLVVEGETDAARCALLYEELDIACLGAGARSFTQAMADQLDSYEMVLVGLDADEAGTAGSEKIIKLLPDAIRFAPPEGKNDWCEIEDGEDIPDVPAFVAHPDDLVVGGLLFPSVEEGLRLDLTAPEQLVDDFMYVEGIHAFTGDPGCGKTSFLMSCARLIMEEGWHVIWLDHESGMRQALRKLVATSVAHNLIISNFHYSPFPKKAEDALHPLVDHWPKSLIIVDSISKALASSGLSENDNSEVTSYTVKLVEFAKRRRVPMALIDHVSKNAKDSMYSRGAGAKLADVDVQWRLNKLSDFNATVQGLVEFRQDKDREGVLPFKQYFEVGGDLGLDFRKAADQREEPEDEPEAGVEKAGI